MTSIARRPVLLAFALALFATAGRTQATLPHTSLADYYAVVKAAMPRAGTNAYVQPSQAEADAFRAAAGRILAGEVLDAIAQFGALGYDVSYLRESGGRTYLVVSEKTASFKGRGTYIVNPAWERSFAFEAPHPLYDLSTGEESIELFTKLGARFLTIAGTHRCASTTPTPCGGTTGACSGGALQPYRISDMAHTTISFFQAAHQAAVDAGMAAMSVHGKASDTPSVEISDGTTGSRDAEALVNRFRTALLSNGLSVGSCNWAADAGIVELCGSTNVQGRFSNGSPDACMSAASSANGTFLHVEQHIDVRRSPAALIAAAAAVLPLSPFTPPQITSLAPASVRAGSSALSVTVHGSGFRAGAVVRSSGADLATTVIDSTTITAILPAESLARSGKLDLVVVNLDSTTTAAATFAVTQSAPKRRSVKH